MKTIGVIGAGVMGQGVTQDLVQKGYRVVLLDVSDEALNNAHDAISNQIRFQGLFNPDKQLLNPETLFERISYSTDYQLLNQIELVIENVTEKRETKKEVYRQLEKISPANCTFLANTSCISITEIASYTTRPDKVIGVHFMNPVPLKTTVEVIRGYHTSGATIAIVDDFLNSLGKEMILVNDFPGFVSNRISHLFMNEAVFVVQDQIATPQEVDDIFKKCYSHKMGPLETADLIGLDTVMNSLDILYESYQDPKFRCCPLLRKMVSAGRLGVKSGRGFYEY